MPWHSKPYDTADGRSVVRIYEDVGDAVPYSRLLTPTEARALAADLVRAADAVEPVARTDGVPPDVWTAFHKRWTDAVGTPGYDKRLWRAQEAALIDRYARPGHAPKVTT